VEVEFNHVTETEEFTDTWSGRVIHFPEGISPPFADEFCMLEFRITCERQRRGGRKYKWEQYINQYLIPEGIAVLPPNEIADFQRRFPDIRVLDAELVTRFLAIRNITGL
jgi:hypothetical protein